MKILVTGANGFLGQHLCRALEKDFAVVATGRGVKRLPQRFDYIDSDIVSQESVEKLVAAVAPDVIVHAAAISRPDECERNKNLCVDVNVKGTVHLVAAAAKLNRVHFIYISSDFVLGDDGPHAEDAIPSPLNFYGETKLEAERVVETSGLFYSIVRPVFMYGETWEGMRPTFLDWVKQSLEEGRPIKVVNDQQRTPTYVGDICNGIRSMIDNRSAGLYHLGGEEVLTPYEMARRFAESGKQDTSLITAVTAATFPEPVARAKKGGVIINKAKAELKYIPMKFEEALRRM